MTAPTISVVIPAYNEEGNVGAVVREVRELLGDRAEVIVVDDGSTDRTANEAREAGARVLSHPYNIGNGAAVKAGIRAAHGRSIVLLDADGQHPVHKIPELLERLDTHAMAVGARTAESKAAPHRRLANAAYNRLAGYVCGIRIPDLTSGFRAGRADLFRRVVYLLPNTFSYPSTLTLSISRAGLPIAFVPIVAEARKGKSKIHLLRDGSRFVLIILRIATFYSPLRVFLPVSIVFTAAGLINYAYTYTTSGRFTNMSALSLVTGVIVFMLGLVAEQVAHLRMERSETRPPAAEEFPGHD